MKILSRRRRAGVVAFAFSRSTGNSDTNQGSASLVAFVQAGRLAWGMARAYSARISVSHRLSGSGVGARSISERSSWSALSDSSFVACVNSRSANVASRFKQPTFVERAIRKAPPASARGHLTDSQLAEARQLYSQGRSLNRLDTKYHIDPKTMKKRLTI